MKKTSITLTLAAAALLAFAACSKEKNDPITAAEPAVTTMALEPVDVDWSHYDFARRRHALLKNMHKPYADEAAALLRLQDDLLRSHNNRLTAPDDLSRYHRIGQQLDSLEAQFTDEELLQLLLLYLGEDLK